MERKFFIDKVNKVVAENQLGANILPHIRTKIKYFIDDPEERTYTELTMKDNPDNYTDYEVEFMDVNNMPRFRFKKGETFDIEHEQFIQLVHTDEMNKVYSDIRREKYQKEHYKEMCDGYQEDNDVLKKRIDVLNARVHLLEDFCNYGKLKTYMLLTGL